MSRRLIFTGSPFEKEAGYSRAVAQGDWCFVSGTTGYDYATHADAGNGRGPDPQLPGDDCRGAEGGRLRHGGCGACPLPRNRCRLCRHVFPVLGEVFGDIRPAATMTVCGLNKPEMKIEIEVTALRRNRPD